MSHCLLVVALAAEARPLIEGFKLSLQRQGPFRQYGNNELTLVECGIGKLAAAAGTSAVLAELTQSYSHCSCLNIGIAGADQPGGTLFAAHQIIDRASQKTWYPQLTGLPVTETTIIETVDQPDSQYQPDKAFEMEASGFVEAATRYTSLEFVHCLKVVSDNPTMAMDTLTRQRVSDLVHSHLETVKKVITAMGELAGRLPVSSSTAVREALSSYGQQFRLSTTQQSHLQQLLNRHHALHGTVPPLPGHNNTKQLIKELSDTLDAYRQSY